MNAPRVSSNNIHKGIAKLGENAVPFGCLPMIIEDVVSRWPAKKNWTPQTLKANFGNEEITCFVANKRSGTFLQQVNEARRMPFGAFLDHVFSASETEEELYYLRIDTGHPLFRELAKDFEIPRFVEGYNPAATGIWIGQKGNITPFHHDWWHSFLAQVSGRKRYTLIHPLEAKILQKDWQDAAKFDLIPAPIYGNGSTLPKKLPASFEGILEPGQILYIPPYWYHQIDTLENGNISMPLRFDTVQSPDVALFQFSQDSSLRTLTNKKATNDATLISHLQMNRQKFLQKEAAFIQAYLETRDSGLTLETALEKLEFEQQRK